MVNDLGLGGAPSASISPSAPLGSVLPRSISAISSQIAFVYHILAGHHRPVGIRAAGGRRSENASATNPTIWAEIAHHRCFTIRQSDAEECRFLEGIVQIEARLHPGGDHDYRHRIHLGGGDARDNWCSARA